jgi:hypothetical protein
VGMWEELTLHLACAKILIEAQMGAAAGHAFHKIYSML